MSSSGSAVRSEAMCEAPGGEIMGRGICLTTNARYSHERQLNGGGESGNFQS